MNKNLINSSKIIPFISIDNEGGQIQRHNFIQNKSAKEISFLDKKLAQDVKKKLQTHKLENLGQYKDGVPEVLVNDKISGR